MNSKRLDLPELQTWRATLRAYRLETYDASIPLPAARALFWDRYDWNEISLTIIAAVYDEIEYD